MPYEGSPAARTAAPPKKPHSLSMEGRRRLSISGVEDVESFDEQQIVMRTSEGGLVICGTELSVSRLSVETGDVSVQGHVTELCYTEPAGERRGLLARLLH